MSVASRNGTPQRKQLSDQLDRLDGIIDCLADGLSDAVRDAVAKGTATAVQQILTEALTNPTTRELIRQAFTQETVKPVMEESTEVVQSTPAVPTRKESFLARCKAAVKNVSRKVASIPGKIAAGVKRLFRKTKAVTRKLNIAWQLKKAAVIGLGIGMVVAVVSLWSHNLAAMLSGVGAAATAFSVQVGLWFRSTARQLIS